MNLERIRRNQNNQIYIAMMRPVFDRRGLFSDTTEDYVSPMEPEPNEEITLHFRTAKNNVDRVFFVTKGRKYMMTKEETDECFDYYIVVVCVACSMDCIIQFQ